VKSVFTSRLVQEEDSAETARVKNRRSHLAKTPSHSALAVGMTPPLSKNVHATHCRHRSERPVSPSDPSPMSECPAPQNYLSQQSSDISTCFGPANKSRNERCTRSKERPKIPKRGGELVDKLGGFNACSIAVRATDPFSRRTQTWATFGDARIEEWELFR